jgi:hypothetical protein
LWCISYIINSSGNCSCINGTDGIDGYTPQFGIDYFNGSDGYTPIFGVDYFNGSDGAQGIQGIQGIQGVNGTNGINGTIPDSSQFYFLNGTRQLTGKLNAGNFNLSNISNPVANQDAATKAYVTAFNGTSGNAWTSYTPIYAWTVTPATPTIGGRYTVIGKTVFFQSSYQSTDSNAGICLNFTLPLTAINYGMPVVALNGFTQNTNSYTPAMSAAFIASGTPTKVTLAIFPTTIDGQYISLFVTGAYEI